MTLQLAGPIQERGDHPLGERCPLDRTLGLVGNRTAMLLLREVAYGTTRFDALARRVGVTDAVASQRLKELVAGGVLERQPYREPGQRTRHEYVLTAAGHQLVPVLVALMAWGDEHVPHRWSVGASHAGCGAPVRGALVCAEGHEVGEDDVVVATRRAS